jgi:hypothetical protein
MREDRVQRHKALVRFWEDIMRRASIFSALGLLISVLFVLGRKISYDPFFPLIIFLIAFGISWTWSFRKTRPRKEFEGDA